MLGAFIYPGYICIYKIYIFPQVKNRSCVAHLRPKLVAAPPRKSWRKKNQSPTRNAATENKSRVRSLQTWEICYSELCHRATNFVDLPISVPASFLPFVLHMSAVFHPIFFGYCCCSFCCFGKRIQRFSLRLPANVLYSFSLFGLLRKFVNLLKGFCCQWSGSGKSRILILLWVVEWQSAAVGIAGYSIEIWGSIQILCCDWMRSAVCQIWQGFRSISLDIRVEHQFLAFSFHI